MTDAGEFLSKIYAGTNGYAYLWTKPDQQSHFFATTDIVGMAESARKLSGSRHDVYCSVGVRKTPADSNHRGTQAEISQIGCLWADVDILDSAAHKSDRLPASIEDAMGIMPTDIPPSIIVASGHGLHVYWLLDRPIDVTPDNWRDVRQLVQKMQQLIRNNASVHGWEIDATADLTRVLRVPGTWNFKDVDNPAACEIIDQSDARYGIDVFQKLSVPVPDKKTDRGQSFTRKPTDGPASMILTNCKFLQHCQLDAKTLTYDEWVAAISNLARAKDGPTACHDISKADPVRYDPSVTDDKIAEVLDNMSPRSCEYIQKTLGFRHCDDCQVKCPASWALEHVHRAVATLRALSNPTPETVFTEDVIGSLALLEKESPVHYQQFRARLGKAVNKSDLSKTIANYRRKHFRTVDTPAAEPGQKHVKTTGQLIPDCPIDLTIPAGYVVDRTGVREYKERADGSVTENTASGVPVVLTARMYNLDTDLEKVEVCFKYYNQWRRTIQSRSTVYSSRSIVKLSDCGLNVSSETAKYLVKYLQQLEAINQDKIPLKYSVSRLGWRDGNKQFILSSQTDYAIEMDDEGDITDAMQQAGSLPGWLTLAKEARGHIFSRFLLSASFAAPLLALFRQRNFMIYFWGSSGGGKTAAMKMAMSVWGDPDRLMTSFLTTKAGLERRLSLLSDFPVAINERQVAGQGREKQDYLEYVVYMLEGGKGKGRATKTGLQKTAWWRVIGMANGEEPLTRENSVKGVKNRILEINTYPVMPDDLAKQVHQMSDYGFAGEMFVKKLLGDKNTAGAIWDAVHTWCMDRYHDNASAHVDALALILTADILSGMWVFDTPQDEAVNQAYYLADQVIKMLPTAHDMSDTERSWDFVVNWIAANEARFASEFGGHTAVTPIYGFAKAGKICIFPSMLRRAMQDEGISYDKMLPEWGAAGKIAQTTDGRGNVRNVQPVWWEGKTCRVIITSITSALPQKSEER
jgi:hypothetical protein